MRKNILFIVLGFSLMLTSCEQRHSIPTVNGPESTDLIMNTAGYILYDNQPRGVEALTLPDLKKITVRDTNKDGGTIHSLSGPARNGYIAYIDNYMMKTRHLLKITSIQGGQEKIIFERYGDALWDHVIGEYLALSPEGKYVAFVGKIDYTQMNNPDVYLGTGPLEIWDINNKTKIQTDITAIDGQLSWFPNGEKIAYSKLVNKSDIPFKENELKGIEKNFVNWPQVPAVFIYNMVDKSDTFLHVGIDPVISTDGNSIIVSDYDNNFCLVNTETKESKPIDWPGRWGSVIAFTGVNSILYWGLPTTGTSPQWTENNSPLVGPKSMVSIKITDLLTGKFQTVIRYIDPRDEISFGQVQN